MSFRHVAGLPIYILFQNPLNYCTISAPLNLLKMDCELPGHILKASDVDTKRLEQSVKYATTRLESARKVSPITSKALKVYLNISKDYMKEDLKNEDVQLEIAANLRAFEATFRESAFQTSKSDTLQRLEDEIANLQRFKFYARYGDYLAHLSRMIKQSASQEESEYARGFAASGYWTDILEAYDEEPWDEYCITPEAERSQKDVQLHITFAGACRRMGLRKDVCLTTVREYGLRNCLMHNDVARRVEAGEFPSLAYDLCTDLNNLSASLPAGMSALESQYNAILKSLINHYWHTKGNLEDYRRWGLRDEFQSQIQQVQEAKALSDDLEVKEAARDAARKAVVNAAYKKHSEKVARHRLVLEAYDARFVPPTYNPIPRTKSLSPKRQASSEHPMGEERAVGTYRDHKRLFRNRYLSKERFKRQRKAWATICGIQDEANVLAENYKSEYGFMTEPEDVLAEFLEVDDEDEEEEQEDTGESMGIEGLYMNQ